MLPMVAPSASICSDIWKASSLVGVRMQANSFWGFSRRACKIGRTNDPVLPEPVSARPITSLPFRATGMASAWILLGFFQPTFSQASQRTSTRPSEANVLSEESVVSSSCSGVSMSGVFSNSTSLSDSDEELMSVVVFQTMCDWYDMVELMVV